MPTEPIVRDAFNTSVVTATGSTTPRALAVRAADVIWADDYILPTEGSDDSIGLRRAIAQALESTQAASNPETGVEIRLRQRRYTIATTENGMGLIVPQRVHLVGQGGAFVNQFTNSINAPKGTVLFAAAGLNADVLCFRLNLSAETINDYRHGGGARDLVVWGNRSSSQAPTVRDTNTAGIGVLVQGSRYVILERVYSMFCAEAGFKSESYDYGSGAISCNNLFWRSLWGHSNFESGFDLSGGDSDVSHLNAGYNGGTGFTLTLSGSLTSLAAWNNKGAGIFVGGTWQQLVGCSAYDNETNGITLSASTSPQLVGCNARGNGVDTGLAITSRCGFLVSADAVNPTLVGCVALGTGTAQTQTYGYYLNAVSSGKITWIGNQYDGTHLTADRFVADYTKLRIHEDITDTTVVHPGFTASGLINMNQFALRNAVAVSLGNAASVSSITSGLLPCAGSTAVTLNVSGGATITDISTTQSGTFPLVILRNINATSLTFTHNTAKIRLAGGVDYTLAQNGAIMLFQVAAGIWQQIEG